MSYRTEKKLKQRVVASANTMVMATPRRKNTSSIISTTSKQQKPTTLTVELGVGKGEPGFKSF